MNYGVKRTFVNSNAGASPLSTLIADRGQQFTLSLSFKKTAALTILRIIFTILYAQKDGAKYQPSYTYCMEENPF
jgi:hypothetical protein